MRLSTRFQAVFLDLAIFALLFFPAICGGFWITRPHFKFELTELAIPTLIVWALAYAMPRAREQSWCLTKARESVRRWREFIATTPCFALSFGTVFIALLWSVTSLRRHWALQSNAYDLGIFTNAIWNLTHGSGYVSSIKGGINLFADHQSPIFWVLAPIFSEFPYPETLLIIQAVMLSLGAAAVFVLGRQYRRDTSLLVALLPILYWVYLPIRRANVFDFHPEVFMLPLFLWAIAGIQSRARLTQGLGFLAFLAALACKETAGPLAVGIGLAWILGASPRRKPFWSAGVLAIALGLAVFFIDLKIPAMLHTQYAYGSLYSHLQLGPGEWVKSLFGLSRLKFLFLTLAPVSFLCLFSPRVMMATLPAYGMLFLTEGPSRLNPQFHYAIEVSVGIFWALAASSAQVESARLFRKLSLGAWIAFWVLLSFGRSEIYWIRRFEPDEHARWLRNEVARCFRSEPSVTASSPLVPQIATRVWVQNIPDLGSPGQPNDCIWIDTSLNAWPQTPTERDAWEARLSADLGYEKFYECGPTRVYQRHDFQGACLRCLPECSTAENR